MVLAGVFLGLFASTLIARPTCPPESSRQRAIDHEVRYYQQTYSLNDVAADAVRQALHTYERDRLELLHKLQAEHPHDFDALRLRTEARIRAVIQNAIDTPAPALPSKRTEAKPKK